MSFSEKVTTLDEARKLTYGASYSRNVPYKEGLCAKSIYKDWYHYQCGRKALPGGFYCKIHTTPEGAPFKIYTVSDFGTISEADAVGETDAYFLLAKGGCYKKDAQGFRWFRSEADATRATLDLVKTALARQQSVVEKLEALLKGAASSE